MEIRIDPAGTVSLDDPDDCRAFSIVGERSAAAESLVDLAGIGVDLTPDLSHGFVDPSLVESLAPERVGSDWDLRFVDLVEYARGHDWLDERGWIRAHTSWH
jgi:hypothetical protein